MPRKQRMCLRGVPAHVVHRGHNREACFFADEDYRFYLACLETACERYGVSVHAYCLMTNQIHLLMTPDEKDSISRLMRYAAGYYGQYVNKTYRRSGALWETRYKSSLVDAKRYLLACYRYIELNPIAASMVPKPSDYRWSSYRTNALGEAGGLISPHPIYLSLAGDRAERLQCYRRLFELELYQSVEDEISGAARLSMPLGDSRSRAQIEKALGRKMGYAKRGRPTKRTDGIREPAAASDYYLDWKRGGLFFKSKNKGVVPFKRAAN